jgi:pantoate--beta-alanine ligase
MKIIESISEMREYSQQLKREGKIIGSVGTEGELHKGHMHLVDVAKENADVVVLDLLHTLDYFRCSAEKYKTQLKVYEQDYLEKEIEICKLNNVDVLFLPSMNDLFFDIPPLNISIPIIDRLSIARPNFSPVCMEFIIAYREMYNIILPDVAVVGQKDVYQNFALKSLIKQLGFSIKVITALTVRDSNGVALNSRNRFLSQDDYKNVISMYQVLQEIASWKEIEPISYIKSYVTYHVKTDICHVDTVCAETLKELIVFDRKMLIVINAFFKDIYLTDNIIMEMK